MCASWTNNASESFNHILKQRVQWHVCHMELIGQCRQLTNAQAMEADRELIGHGDLVLHKDHARFRTIAEHWRSMSDRQRQRLQDDCFKL